MATRDISMTKTALLKVRLSDEDLELLKDVADRLGVSVSEYVRDSIRSERCANIIFRVSQEENDGIRANAARAGQTLSDFIRTKCLNTL